MNRRLAILGSMIILGFVGSAAGWLVSHADQLTLLQARGPIAAQERNLMGVALSLMLLVIVPVYGLIFSIAIRYRAGNTKAKYRPNWDSDRRLETIWWGIPLAIIATLAVITWTSTHQLDPYRPISSNQAPLKVQVIALQYKWLFMYPEYNVASVNRLVIPAGRTIDFQITADAPMNSFWIPQLGGQIYAMPGMSTRLSLQADAPGEFRGWSANLSGPGFADMHFVTQAVDDSRFDQWVSRVRAAGGGLDAVTYNTLAAAHSASPPRTYAVVAADLYDEVVMNYMTPMVHDHD